MKNQKNHKPDYGNWVPDKLLYGSGGLGVVFLALSFLHLLFIVLALFFCSALAYFIYARYQFGSKGGNLQVRVRELVLEYLKWDGKGEAIDIGCGNGPLVIKLAKKYPGARVTGVDYWGRGWDYSREKCERNAGVEGVTGQVRFERASASGLPYEDGRFDAAVSNFVFHEVAGVRDKKELIREALRVVRKGGAFSFQDLFMVKKFYGRSDELLDNIKSLGITTVALAKTNVMAFIPGALKLPFMLGTMGIIYGRK